MILTNSFNRIFKNKQTIIYSIFSLSSNNSTLLDLNHSKKHCSVKSHITLEYYPTELHKLNIFTRILTNIRILITFLNFEYATSSIFIMFLKLIRFLIVGLIIGFFLKIIRQYKEFHRSLSWFDKFLWYAVVLYMIFIIVLYAYFHYQLWDVNRKVEVFNVLIKIYYQNFKFRENLMIATKYKLQEVARRRLWFARHLNEIRHPHDDGMLYLVGRDFYRPGPWAKYGTKR